MAQAQSYIPPDRPTNSRSLWERARLVSPMGAQGEGKYYPPYPHFIARAFGAKIWDADGREYIDYWNGAGPCVLGHGDPEVNIAVFESIARHGVLFCAPHEAEVALCETLAEFVPSAEMSAFLNAGTDVLCMALRVARAATGRSIVVKFAGSYHGWYDSLLFNITSYDGPADNTGRYRPIAESSGIPEEAVNSVRVLEYNNIAAVEHLFEQEGCEIAAIVVEPIMHGPLAGCIPPVAGFLERLRALCTEHGSILVFDEILTGFRHDIGGTQRLCGVTPDLTAFGKAISNGFPLAALCGRRNVMENLSPHGGAYFSGTYNGNVTSVAAALATIAQLKDGTVHDRLWRLGDRLRDGFNEVFHRHGLKARSASYGSLVAIHFTDQPLCGFGDVVRSHDMTKSRDFVSFLYENGVYTKPRKVLRFAISGAHTPADIDQTVALSDAHFKKQRE
jgi:glutamate-1-semialdehyde 2,1-aminomutase